MLWEALYSSLMALRNHEKDLGEIHIRNRAVR
jgi:hypothetical protein